MMFWLVKNNLNPPETMFYILALYFKRIMIETQIDTFQTKFQRWI